MTNFNIRVQHDANNTLNELINQRKLIPVAERIEGVSGQVYALTDSQPLVQSHFACQIAGRTIHANLYALPPEEYAGLLRASPDFTHRSSVAPLIPALLRPMTGGEKEAWLRQLVTILRTPANNDLTPHLLLSQPVTPAQWQAEKTRLVRQDAGWFMCLFFEPPTVQVAHGVQRSAAGVDIGLNTLAVAAYRTGLVHRASGVTDVCLPPELLHSLCSNDLTMQAELKRHVLLLQHAAARLEFNQLLGTLLASASVVYVEDLKYKEVNDAFKRRSRELGIRDFLMSWLPKRLTAQGIPWQRIKPDRTSQYCSLTHRRGERDSHDRTRFRNGNGEVVDADLNAALNIMQLGFSYRVEYGL